MSRYLLLAVIYMLTVSSFAAEPETLILYKQDLEHFFPVSGEVVASFKLNPGVRISGRLEVLYPRPGDIVEDDEILALIEAPELDALYQQRYAELQAAKADLQDARDDVKRLERLTGSQAVSEDELRNLNVRKSQATASVAAHVAALAAIQVDRDERTLRSPGRLRILQRMIEPGDPVIANTPLLQAESLDNLRFEIYVTQKRLQLLKPGRNINIDINSKMYKGTINKVVHSIDSATRRGKVEIKLLNQHDLIPGQYGIAYLPDDVQKVLLIPLSTLIEKAGIPCAFIVDSERKVRLRSLRLGRIKSDNQIVISGLQEGDEIILNPPANLVEGMSWPNQ